VSYVPEFGAGLRRSQDLRSCGHTRNRRFLGTARPGVRSGHPDCISSWRGRIKRLPERWLCRPPTRSSPPFRSDCRPTSSTGAPRSINADTESFHRSPSIATPVGDDRRQETGAVVISRRFLPGFA
jgi:hypothetical protein